MQILFNTLVRFFLLLSLSLPLLALAEDKSPPDLKKSIEQVKTSFESLQKKKSGIKTKAIDELLSTISSLQAKTDACVADFTAQKETLEKNLKLLGDKQTSELSDIKTSRNDLENQLKQADNKLTQCNLYKIQLTQMGEKITQIKQKRLKTQLLSREMTPLYAFYYLSRFNADIYEQEFDTTQSLIEKTYQSLTWPVLFLVLVGLGIGILLRRHGHAASLQINAYSSPTLVAAIRGVRNISPLILPFFLNWLYLKIEGATPGLLIQAVQYTLIILVIFALIRGVLFSDIYTLTSSKLSRRILQLFSWSFIFFSVVAFTFSSEDSGRFSGSAILYLIWLIALLISAISLVIVLWNLMQLFMPKSSISTAYLLPLGAVVVSVIAALSGYRNLATWLFFGTLGSAVVLIIALLVNRIFTELFDSLDEGKRPWQKKLRHAMNINNSQAFPGVLWLRILLFFVVVFVTIYALMIIWGQSQQQVSSQILSLKNGITIGKIHLDIFNIVYALLILIVSLSIIPLIKNSLIPNWLKHSNLNRGAIEATQTLVGYVLVAIAILWALYVLGLNFQNLAIIAGALSVGIGFGLQNIVNNFVSGLILLFERPVRRGDWIMVGDTEGYVRNISIRSTTIQTFDRADVVVPNSELISTQVTNWMLSSDIGRLRLPIGVAYGSDVKKVMEILEDIAKNHPEVLKDHPLYPIRVLFLEFGDSSLNFELRCFIKNIDNRRRVQSDINLSIDSEFRKANIEIPFPQRVVHMQRDSEQGSE